MGQWKQCASLIRATKPRKGPQNRLNTIQRVRSLSAAEKNERLRKIHSAFLPLGECYHLFPHSCPDLKTPSLGSVNSTSPPLGLKHTPICIRTAETRNGSILPASKGGSMLLEMWWDEWNWTYTRVLQLNSALNSQCGQVLSQQKILHERRRVARKLRTLLLQGWLHWLCLG